MGTHARFADADFHPVLVPQARREHGIVRVAGFAPTTRAAGVWSGPWCGNSGNKARVTVVSRRCHLGVDDPRVLVSVAPQVAPGTGGLRPPARALTGQGKDILRRRMDGHDGEPVGTKRAGGGLGHHRDGGAVPGAVPDGPPAGVKGHGRGGGFQDLGVEPAERAAHELQYVCASLVMSAGRRS